MNDSNLYELCREMALWWSNHTPFSYETIFVWLFFVIQPSLILFFFVETILMFIMKKGTAKNLLLIFSIFVLVCYIIWIILLFGLPFFDIASDMRLEGT